MSKGSVIAIFVLSIVMSFGFGSLMGYSISENKDGISKAIGMDNSSVEIPMPDGRIVKVPANHAVRIRMQYGGSTEAEGHSKTKVIGSAKGGFKLNPGPTDTTNIGTPTLDLTEGQERGEGGALDTMQKGAKNGSNILIIAGIAFLAAGVLVIILLKMVLLGGAICVIGGILIGTGLLFQAYPWMLIVCAVVVIGGIGGFLWWAWKTGRLKTTVEKIVGAIEKTDTDTQKTVKDKIKAESATPKEQKIVKKTVSGIKEKL